MKPNNLYPTPLITGIISDGNPVKHTITIQGQIPEHKAFDLEMHITKGLGYDPIRTEIPKEETEADLIRHLGKMEMRYWENSYQSENFEKRELGGALVLTEDQLYEKTVKLELHADDLKLTSNLLRDAGGLIKVLKYYQPNLCHSAYGEELIDFHDNCIRRDGEDPEGKSKFFVDTTKQETYQKEQEGKKIEDDYRYNKSQADALGSLQYVLSVTAIPFSLYSAYQSATQEYSLAIVSGLFATTLAAFTGISRSNENRFRKKQKDLEETIKRIEHET